MKTLGRDGEEMIEKLTSQNAQAGPNSQAKGAQSRRTSDLQRRVSAVAVQPPSEVKLSVTPAEARPKSALWTVSLGRSRAERLAFVEESRRRTAKNERAGLLRDQVSSSESQRFARECWARHLSEPRKASEWAIEDALADFGLKPRNRSELSSLRDILKGLPRCIDFPRFLNVIEQARHVLRSSFAEQVFQAWKTVDAPGYGVLDREGCLNFLKALHLAPPQFPEEERFLEATLDMLPWNEAKEILFEFAEFLFLRVREFREAHYRTRERELVDEHQLKPCVVKRFVGHLVEFHEAFVKADEDESGALSADEIVRILLEFGVLRDGAEQTKKEAAIHNIKDDVNFPTFLKIVEALRIIERERRWSEVTKVFSQYDVDNSGELDSKEICAFLIALDLLPNDQQQQEKIGRLIEELDADGSGMFNLTEVRWLVQRVSEIILMVKRRAELKKGVELGYWRNEVFKMRGLFDELDRDNSGSLSLEEVGKAVKRLGWPLKRCNIQKLIEEADDDGNRELTFEEFLAFMSQLKNYWANDDGLQRRAVFREEDDDPEANAPPPPPPPPVAAAPAAQDVAHRFKRRMHPSLRLTASLSMNGANTPRGSGGNSPRGSGGNSPRGSRTTMTGTHTPRPRSDGK